MFTRLRRRRFLLLMAAVAGFAAVLFLGCSGESIGEALARVVGYGSGGGGGGSGGGGGGGTGSEVNPNTVVKGTFTDSRNSKVYKTVKIGTQTWMAEDLNYQTADSWCYDNETNNCVKYGRLYTWAAAKSACPSGWHLPSRQEWNTLETAVGSSAGKKLKSTNGWNDFYFVRYGKGGNGTDAYGFSALPGGYRSGFDGRFFDAGDYGSGWTVTEYSSDRACFWGVDYRFDYVSGGDTDKDTGIPVRCLHD